VARNALKLLIPGLATVVASFRFCGTFLFAFCDDEYEIPPLVRIAPVIISIFWRNTCPLDLFTLFSCCANGDICSLIRTLYTHMVFPIPISGIVDRSNLTCRPPPSVMVGSLKIYIFAPATSLSADLIYLLLHPIILDQHPLSCSVQTVRPCQ
jgi:hypothetical protein